MIIPSLFFAIFGLKQDFVIPAEASAEYRKLATEIEGAIAERDFTKGSKLISRLPGTMAAYRIDLSKVAQTKRPVYQAAITAAAKAWQTGLADGITFKSFDSGVTEILFRFDPTAAGFGWQFVQDPSSSRVTATASLKPGIPLPDVAAGAKLAFARYMGIGTVSKSAGLTDKDIQVAKKIFTLSRLLEDSIQALAPTFNVPVGASTEFHHLVLDIESALIAKDFVRAEKLSHLLPTVSVSWSLDTSKLNADQKTEYSQIAKAVENQWQMAVGEAVKFKKVDSGRADIAISFEPILSKISGTSGVAGAAIFLGADSTQPRVETVIGLKRGSNLLKVLGREVYNECLFTFGRYFGLAPNPMLGTAMGRVEGQMFNPNSIASQEMAAARKIIKLSQQLREAIQKKQVIESVHPILSLGQESIAFKEQFQGDEGRAQVLVTNTGNSPLEIEVRGDCGCINGEVVSVLAPGKSTFLTGIFNTIELAGDVHHNLILKTNDPDRPMIIIPVSISVIPRAEVVFPSSNTAYMDTSEQSFSFYVNSVEPKLFKVIEIAVIGLPFTAKSELYDGEQPNFMKQGQIQKIHGYKVTVDTSKMPVGAIFGRQSAMVYVRTDNPKLGVVKAQMFVQKGIVSLPESVYLGSPQGVSDSSLVLIRLGRPFKVKSITSDSKYLTFENVPNSPTYPSGYTIRVIYDGKAPGHRLKGTITVETDDAKQPTIKIPFQTSQT